MFLFSSAVRCLRGSPGSRGVGEVVRIYRANALAASELGTLLSSLIRCSLRGGLDRLALHSRVDRLSRREGRLLGARGDGGALRAMVGQVLPPSFTRASTAVSVAPRLVSGTLTPNVAPPAAAGGKAYLEAL
jgi:hypothetical protein